MCPAKREASTKRCRQELPEAKEKEGEWWTGWGVGVGLMGIAMKLRHRTAQALHFDALGAQ